MHIQIFEAVKIGNYFIRKCLVFLVFLLKTLRRFERFPQTMFFFKTKKENMYNTVNPSSTNIVYKSWVRVGIYFRVIIFSG